MNYFFKTQQGSYLNPITNLSSDTLKDDFIFEIECIETCFYKKDRDYDFTFLTNANCHIILLLLLRHKATKLYLGYDMILTHTPRIWYYQMHSQTLYCNVKLEIFTFTHITNTISEFYNINKFCIWYKQVHFDTMSLFCDGCFYNKLDEILQLLLSKNLNECFMYKNTKEKNFLVFRDGITIQPYELLYGSMQFENVIISSIKLDFDQYVEQVYINISQYLEGKRSFTFERKYNNVIEAVIACDIQELEYMVIEDNFEMYIDHVIPYALNNKDLEMIQWILNEGKWINNISCPYKKQINKDCIEWLYANGFGWNKEVTIHAAKYGYLNCLDYAYTHGCELSDETCSVTAQNGCLECLHYSHIHGCKITYETIVTAVVNNQINCLKYLHQEGCKWNSYVTLCAAQSGNLDCLRYLLENGCPYNVQDMIVQAFENAQIHILKYLLEYRYTTVDDLATLLSEEQMSESLESYFELFEECFDKAINKQEFINKNFINKDIISFFLSNINLDTPLWRQILYLQIPKKYPLLVNKVNNKKLELSQIKEECLHALSSTQIPADIIKYCILPFI
jgi:hypothetical protein